MRIYDTLISKAINGGSGGGGGGGGMFTEVSVSYQNHFNRSISLYGYTEDSQTWDYVLNGIYVVNNTLTVYATIANDVTEAMMTFLLPPNGFVMLTTGENATATGNVEVVYDENYGDYVTVVRGNGTITITA